MPVIACDDDYGKSVVIIFTLLVVFIEGKNLQSVITAIENEMAESIQEFDSARWEMPNDPSAPVIESIQVVVQPGGPVGTDGKPMESLTVH